MKRAFFMTPLIVALVFAIPEGWQQIKDPGPGYVPVVNELLIFAFAYLAALLINACLIVPLCLLVKLKTSNLFAGIGMALFVALVGTTVAYALEIFDYQSSILHPAYRDTLLIPLFVMSALSFFLLTRSRAKPATADSGAKPPGETEAAEPKKPEAPQP